MMLRLREPKTWDVRRDGREGGLGSSRFLLPLWLTSGGLERDRMECSVITVSPEEVAPEQMD